MSSSSSNRPRCFPEAERDLDDDELDWAELFLEDDVLPESEALVLAKDDEMDRLATRDSSSGAREEEADEFRDGIAVDSVCGSRREIDSARFGKAVGLTALGGRLSAGWKDASQKRSPDATGVARRKLS